jgi:hypothetical protein
VLDSILQCSDAEDVIGVLLALLGGFVVLLPESASCRYSKISACLVLLGIEFLHHQALLFFYLDPIGSVLRPVPVFDILAEDLKAVKSGSFLKKRLLHCLKIYLVDQVFLHFGNGADHNDSLLVCGLMIFPRGNGK